MKTALNIIGQIRCSIRWQDSNQTSNRWLKTLYLWFKTLYLWLKTLFSSNRWLKTLHITAFMLVVEKTITFVLGDRDPGSAQDGRTSSDLWTPVSQRIFVWSEQITLRLNSQEPTKLASVQISNVDKMRISTDGLCVVSKHKSHFFALLSWTVCSLTAMNNGTWILLKHCSITWSQKKRHFYKKRHYSSWEVARSVNCGFQSNNSHCLDAAP